MPREWKNWHVLVRTCFCGSCRMMCVAMCKVLLLGQYVIDVLSVLVDSSGVPIVCYLFAVTFFLSRAGVTTIGVCGQRLCIFCMWGCVCHRSLALTDPYVSRVLPSFCRRQTHTGCGCKRNCCYGSGCFRVCLSQAAVEMMYSLAFLCE